jgi:hypothetical protein
MAYNLNGTGATISAVCLTANLKPTGSFLGVKIHRNPVLDALDDIHQSHKADFSFVTTSELGDAIHKIRVNSAGLFIFDAEFVSNANNDGIDQITALFLKSEITPKAIIILSEGKDIWAELAKAKLEIGDGMANKIECHVTSKAYFFSVLRRFVMQNAGDAITNDVVFEKTLGAAQNARIQNVTSGMAPHLRKGMEDRIRGGGKGNPEP